MVLQVRSCFDPIELNGDTGTYVFTSRVNRSLNKPSFSTRLRPAWFYNPMHDLESLWWIMAWFLFSKDFLVTRKTPLLRKILVHEEEDDATRHRRLKEQMYSSREVFGSKRPMVFMIDDELYDQMQSLHPAVVDIGGLLEEARFDITEAYRKAEIDRQNIDITAVDGLHDKLQLCLQNSATHAEGEEYSVDIAASIYKAVNRIRDSVRA